LEQLTTLFLNIRVGYLATIKSDEGTVAHMYRIILACEGVPANAGETGARDIAQEFKNRPWHENVTCSWDGSRLILQADNDFDSNGSALTDEFSDLITACIADGFDGNIKVLSITSF
jgi:hypothetical protein